MSCNLNERTYMRAEKSFKPKMNPETEEITYFSLRLLWYGRYHPNLNPLWSTIVMLTDVAVGGLFVILSVKGVQHSYKTDPFLTAEYLQSGIIMFQLSKQVALHVHKATFSQLLKQSSKFWKIHDFQGPIYQECETILRFGKFLVRFYFYMLGILAVLVCMQPFVLGRLPYNVYIPEGWFNYLVIFSWHLVFTVVFNTVGTDGFFCSTTIYLGVQFKLLGHRFQTLEVISSHKDEKKLWNDLKVLVNYYRFLTRYCETLNTIYNTAFIFQFIIAIVSGSIAVFIFMQPGEWAFRAKSLVLFSAQIVQIAFYCLPVEFAMDAANNLSKAIYDLEWYKVTDEQFKRCLTIILAKAQREITFSGYGLVYINLRTFVLICKTTFSYYTYLNSVRNI